MYATRIKTLAVVRFACVAAQIGAAAAQTPITWTGAAGDGLWNTAGNWNPAMVPNNDQQNSFLVTISSARVVSSGMITIDALTLTGGGGAEVVNSSGDFTVLGTTDAIFGILSGTGGVFMLDGGIDVETALTIAGASVSTDTVRVGVGAPNGTVQMNGGSLSVAGELILLRDGGVALLGGSPLLILSSGSELRKDGGGGLSDINVDVSATGASIVAASGTLRIAGAVNQVGGRLEARGTGTLQLLAPANTFSSDVTFVGESGNTISVGGGQQAISGATLRSSGNGLVTFGSGATLSAAATRLLAEPNMPFVLDDATVNGQPTNEGTLIFERGLLNGGLSNMTGATLRIGPGTFSRSLTQGALSNAASASVEQRDALTLDDMGVVNNSGTWRILAGTEIRTAGLGAQTALFSNNGRMVLDTGAAFSNSVISAPFVSAAGSTLEIDFGSLTIIGADFEQTKLVDCFVDVDGQRNPGNALIVGFDGASRSTLENVTFIFSNDGAFRWAGGGQHRVRGQLVGGGQGTADNAGVTLIADAGGASFDFDGFNTLRFTSANSDLRCDGNATNRGQIAWLAGAVTGVAELVNEDTLGVVGVLRISRGGGGAVRNTKTLDVIGGNNGGITLDAGGRLINDASGTIGLSDDSDIGGQPGAGRGDVDNAGVIEKTGGAGSFLTANYVQQSQGVLRSSSGAIDVQDGSVDILGGRLEANGGSARIIFHNDTTIQNVEFGFANGGSVAFSGGATTLHEFSGTLRGSGDGRLEISTAGRFEPTGVGVFELTGAARVDHISGVVGAVGGNMVNRGAVLMRGGETAGSYTNAASSSDPNRPEPTDFTFEGGRIKDTFLNNGDFTWRNGGFIEGQFTNDPAAGRGMTIAGSNNLLLAAGATLTSRGDITHSGDATLQLGENALLVNDTGAFYIFQAGGDISRVANVVENARMINRGNIINQAITSSINVPFLNEGGTIEAVEDLQINGAPGVTGGEAQISGGVLESSVGLLSTLSAALSGTIVHELNNGGNILHNGPTVSNATFQLRGQGQVDVDASTVNAALAIASQDGATLEFEGGHTWNGAVSASGGTTRFQGGAFDMTGGGSFTNATGATLEMVSLASSPLTLRGPDGGARSTITNNGVTCTTDTGSANIVFDRSVEFINKGTFLVESDRGMDTADPDDDALFRNIGNFCKSGGVSTSFISVPFDNPGTVEVKTASLTISPSVVQQLQGNTLTGGAWIVNPDTVLSLDGGAAQRILTNNGKIIVRGNGVFVNLPDGSNTAAFTNNGTLCLEDNPNDPNAPGPTFITSGEFKNNGTVKVSKKSTLSTTLLDNDGQLRVDGTLTFGQESRWQSGRIAGNGTVNGTRITSGATTAPGASPGQLTINADFVNDPNGVIEIELGGLTPVAGHDVLVIGGPLTLSGQLHVLPALGFVPQVGQQFEVITAQSISGQFSIIRGPGRYDVDYGATSVTLTVLQSPCPGDLNGDNVSDLTDLAILLANFGRSDGVTYADGDFDGDGVVGLVDLAVLLGDFGTLCN